MAEDKKTTDEPFLQRWARRKAEAVPRPVEAEDTEEPAVETAAVDAAGGFPAQTGETAETGEIDLASLPDINSLDEKSDFTVFMRDGIPEALRTRALQRLWRLDPAFGHIDGLLEYGEDFAGGGLAAETVSTIYKVGKGMMSDDEEAEANSETEPKEESPADADEETGPDGQELIATGDEPSAEPEPEDRDVQQITEMPDSPDRTG